MKLLLTLLFTLNLLPVLAQNVTEIQHLNGQSIRAETLHQRLERIVDSTKLAGLQVAIINSSKTVWTSSFGYKDIENQKLLNDSTIMYAASLTKPVSAYIFLRLVDKGIFNLDKPVHFYLKKPIDQYPKWKDLADDTVAFNRITPRMLLSHSSGLPVLRQLYGNKVNLISRPGEKFYYSNEGINLLGFMIEEYTGKRLEAIAREEVFDPLDMPHTSMIWEKSFENNFSNAYFKDGKKYGSERRESSRAAGSMSTTADDYARFIINLMKRKGLQKTSMLQMLSPQIAVTSKRGFGALRDSVTHENDAIKLSWGLGIGLFRSPYGKGFFHTGHGDANQNYAVAFPEKGIAVVLLSNSENFEKVSSLIVQACIGDTYSPFKWLGHLD
ncbi:CubicO group peptidase, beta-lactamase class C family [Filimonas lacunae]|uniref:CubicO group peptidase, beta-lactamase class C family n=1 Tax=Filimonas lacunae TaxID=477680 RepID=A0A173MB06_9BACT|nr:serine hydrolase domain-containing protein [Filimonas lacunae]BAV04735.1 beta-lactamase class C and other penicillin binding proteins [Filimonas lacunae]SIT32234.1 CubicO group peptidase, beta-lactamase class C family [Filimonas lacunae]